MEKNRSQNFSLHLLTKRKVFFVTKLLFVFLFLMNLNLSANVWGQEIERFVVKNATLEQCLQKIEQLTGNGFFYNKSEMKNSGKITLDLKNVELKDLLVEVVKGTDFEFSLVDNIIVVKKSTAQSAQQPQAEKVLIKGVVKDKNGEVLPGVTISIKERPGQGAATQMDGTYVLEVTRATPMTLVFSFIGMKTVEVAYTGQAEINAVLEENAAELEQVVVTGIFTKRKDSYTGAVTVISAQELQQFKGRNLISTIGNIDPAVNLLANTYAGSDPNRLPDIQIRGTSGLPANINDLREENRNAQNNPLVVLDGFEVPMQKMLDMNEAEVASITILKDAAASALYGSRASNGVIVITSKLPEPGKLRVTYRGDLNIEAPDLSQYRLLNAADKLQLEWDRGMYKNNTNMAANVDLQSSYNARLADVLRGVDTYWLSQPLRTSYGQSHSIKLEGGSPEFRYAAGVRYNTYPGVMKESKRDAISTDVTLTYNYKNLLFRNSVNVTFGNSENSPYGSFRNYVGMNPYYRPYDENGKIQKVLANNSVYYVAPGTITNPLYNATVGARNFSEYMEFIDNFSVEWNVRPDLRLRGSFGYSKNMSEAHDFKPADHTSFEGLVDEDLTRRGSYGFTSSNSGRYELSLNAAYTKLFKEKHQVDAGVNASLSQSDFETRSVLVEGFTNPDLNFFGAATAYQENGKPSGSATRSRQVGLTATANYYYDSRYYVEGSIRMDGDSRFGADNRFAPFWSVGTGWNVHNEKFFTPNPYVSRLKFRVSYGLTGSNNFDVSQAHTVYRYNTYEKYGYFQGANIVQMGNEQLKWQQTKETNFGVEAGFFDDRLSVDFNLYKRRTDDLLADMDLSLTTGYASYKENAGSLENKGFELAATTHVIRNSERRLYWSVTGAIMQNRDKIVKISDALKEKNEEQAAAMNNEIAGQSSMRWQTFSVATRPVNMLLEGQSQSVMYVVRSLGIDPASGREVFMKKNGNPTYTWSSADLVPTVTTAPDFRGNLSTTLRYQDFTMTASFAYQYGGHRYNFTLLDRVENARFFENVDQRVATDRWQKIGDQSFFKGINETGATYATSRFIQKENIFQCQNLSLSYEFGRMEWVKNNLKTQQLSLTFNMNDLFYLSSVKQERGIDYPFARRFSLSLSAIF